MLHSATLWLRTLSYPDAAYDVHTAPAPRKQRTDPALSACRTACLHARMHRADTATADLTGSTAVQAHCSLDAAMASSLRSSLAQGGRALRLSPPLQSQQQRFAGQLPVKSNKYIEEWGTYRENLEHHFKFDNAAWVRIALWGVGFPVFIYKMSVAEFNKTDELYGREKREFM